MNGQVQGLLESAVGGPTAVAPAPARGPAVSAINASILQQPVAGISGGAMQHGGNTGAPLGVQLGYAYNHHQLHGPPPCLVSYPSQAYNPAMAAAGMTDVAQQLSAMSSPSKLDKDARSRRRFGVILEEGMQRELPSEYWCPSIW